MPINTYGRWPWCAATMVLPAWMATVASHQWLREDGRWVAGRRFPGEARGSIFVRLHGDDVAEPDETFRVQLTGVDGPATIDAEHATTTVTIINDDGPVVTPPPTVPPTTGRLLTRFVIHKATLRQITRRGFTEVGKCRLKCHQRVQITVPRATARRLHLPLHGHRPVVVATYRTTFAAGHSSTHRVRLTRAAHRLRARAKRAHLHQIRFTWTAVATSGKLRDTRHGHRVTRVR